MSRAEAIARRAEVEAEASPHAILAFATITHPALSAPLRVVSDVMPYVVDGDFYKGVPFGFRLLPEGEAPPRAEIVLQAVDRRITRTLRSLTGRARVDLAIRTTADFDLSAEPRVATGPAAPIYGFAHFTLRDVDGDASQLAGSVMLADHAVEPFGLRATQARCPGLFF